MSRGQLILKSSDLCCLPNWHWTVLTAAYHAGPGSAGYCIAAHIIPIPNRIVTWIWRSDDVLAAWHTSADSLILNWKKIAWDGSGPGRVCWLVVHHLISSGMRTRVITVITHQPVITQMITSHSNEAQQRTDIFLRNGQFELASSPAFKRTFVWKSRWTVCTRTLGYIYEGKAHDGSGDVSRGHNSFFTL